MLVLRKIMGYVKAVVVMTLTVFWLSAVDFTKLEDLKEVMIYCFVTANVILWSYYYMRKFYKEFKDDKKAENEIKEITK